MIGHTVGQYRVTRKLGQGGMGTVYQAEHALLGRSAAIKMLLPELCRNQEMVSRFFNEARAATAVRHPGIVEIYDFGYHEDGSAFIVMEFLQGEPLTDRLRRLRVLPCDRALTIIRQVSSALGAAHQTGIVHRDLKPDNIFLVPDPDVPAGERAKLLDFGIAKLAGDELKGPVKTRTGAVMGTPAYMAPEQCRGAGHVDFRADLYAVGCIFYEMLCGRPPFAGEGVGEVLAAHIHVPLVPVSQLNSQVPPAVAQIVTRLLEKDPQRRYQSAAELAAAIDSLGAVPGGRAPSSEEMAAYLPASQTTLGAAAASRSASSIVGGKKRWLMPMIAGGLLGVAGIVTAVMLARGTSQVATGTAIDSEPAAAVETPPVADPRPAAAALVAMPVDAAPQPKQIEVVFTSRPTGATVRLKNSDHVLGTTPYTGHFLEQDGAFLFVVHRDGYLDEDVKIPGSQDATRSLHLHRKPSKPTTTHREPPPPKKKPRPKSPPQSYDPFSN